LALTKAEYAGVLLELFERHDIAAGISELREAVGQADYARAGAAKESPERLEHDDETVYKALVSAVASINAEMRRYEKKPGHADLNKYFGHYQELSGILTRINRQIESAREDREQRDRLCRDIAEGFYFKAALNYLGELRGVIVAINRSVARENRGRNISLLFTFVSTALLAFGVIAAYIALF